MLCNNAREISKDSLVRSNTETREEIQNSDESTVDLLNVKLPSATSEGNSSLSQPHPSKLSLPSINSVIVPASTNLSHFETTKTLPLFKNTSWIHFSAKQSLSVEFPLDHPIPHSTHKMTFKNCGKMHLLVKHTLFAHGFSECKGADVPSILWSTIPFCVSDVRQLRSHQRANHFLRIQSLVLKDCLCENIQRMQQIKGLKHFDIIPKTFILPQEMTEFEKAYRKLGGIWIVKPAALSRGRGIYLINNPCQISNSMHERLVISQYIEDPFCINGLKFDLRLYVLVTSFDPLRIYLYEEGLGRFASVPYQKDPTNINDLSMHLTNSSVNKYHSDYTLSSDPELDNVGHKWSSSAVLRHLKEQGHDTDKLLTSIEDAIIKTIIAGETPISASLHLQPYHGNCFSLLGFDVLLDKNLKPWILEVNCSPSLNCDSPFDLKLKSSLLADLYSLVGVSLETSNKSHDPPLGKKTIVHTHNTKHVTGNCRYKSGICLKCDETTILAQTKGEYKRRGGFVRIFPAADTWERYSVFLENRTKHNYLLHRNLYPDNGRIKWPPSASCDISTIFKCPLVSKGQRLKNTVFDLTPSQRIEMYIRKLSLDCSPVLTERGNEKCENIIITGDDSLLSDLHYENVVSVYLRKLSNYLLSINFDEYMISHDIEKLMHAFVHFLMVALSPPNRVIVPDQYLSPVIRFRMIIQQLKDFVLTYSNKHLNIIKGTMEERIENSDLTDLEEIILNYSSNDPLILNLVKLINHLKYQQTHVDQIIIDKPTIKTTSEKKYVTNTTRQLSARSIGKSTRQCKTSVSRPHSVSNLYSPIPGTRRGLKTEGDSTEDLCDDTNRVIAAALQRLSIRQD